MRSQLTITALLVAALLAGCTACARHNEADGGLDWDLSESGDDLDLGAEEDALASLVTCGEPGDSVSHNDLSPLEGCERSYYTIVISTFGQSELTELRSLVRTEDLLHVIYGFDLTDLTDLSRLEFVGGNLMIRSMPDLTTLRGLDSLRTVKGPLFLTALGIRDFSSLSSLTSVGGLHIWGHANLESMEGFDSLELIDGDVNISADGVSREELDQFLDRVEVTGTVTFNGEEI